MTTKTRTDQSIVSPTSDTGTPSNTDSTDTWVSWDAQEYADRVPEDQIKESDRRRRTNNETSFKSDEGGGKRISANIHQPSWEKMKRYHHRVEPTDRSYLNLSGRATIELKLHTMAALGHQLEVGQWLISKATHELFNLDLSETGYPVGIVGFCLYVHLYDEATSDYAARTQRRHNAPSPGTDRPYWPARDAKHNDDSFQRVADDLTSFHSLTESNLLSILQKQIQGGLPTDLDSYQPSNSDLASC